MRKSLQNLTLTFPLFCCVAFWNFGYGQITTTNIVENKQVVDKTPYDSTLNFLGKDVYKYLGQELYVKGKAESLREYGYDGFVIDYNFDKFKKGNTYKGTSNGLRSIYEELVGKYFMVLEVIPHPKVVEDKYAYDHKFFLKLQEKKSGDIVYFEYDSWYDFNFPFVVVGFFDKQKSKLVGREFVFKDNYFAGSNDIITGNPITIVTGQKWKCLDFTIEETYYSLVMIVQNPLGEKQKVTYDGDLTKWEQLMFSSTEADNYRKKFGSENFNLILKGEVKIGMTKAMCKLSWGEPESINETITSYKKTEQWVYSNNYLYFEKGLLTVIQ